MFVLAFGIGELTEVVSVVQRHGDGGRTLGESLSLQGDVLGATHIPDTDDALGRRGDADRLYLVVALRQQRDVLLQLVADIDGRILVSHVQRLAGNLDVGGGVMHDYGHLGCGLRVVDRRHGEHGGAGLHGLDCGARHADGVALCHTPLVGLVGGILG